jgi:hypothetical protein
MLAIWALAVGSGFVVLGIDHARPGIDGATASVWPATSQIRPVGPGLNLVLFVHPRCPCTPASLVELAGIVSACRGRFALHVVMVKPSRVDSRKVAIVRGFR